MAVLFLFFFNWCLLQSSLTGVKLMTTKKLGTKTSRCQQNRARWCLAYTLLNNPSLLAYRKGALSDSTPNGTQSSLGKPWAHLGEMLGRTWCATATYTASSCAILGTACSLTARLAPTWVSSSGAPNMKESGMKSWRWDELDSWVDPKACFSLLKHFQVCASLLFRMSLGNLDHASSNIPKFLVFIK